MEQTTPDTFNYMVAGYITFGVIMITYVISLIVRWNNLKKELHILDESEKK